MKAEEVIQEVVKLCRIFNADKIILYGSRAKGTATERSDIDIAVSGIDDFDELAHDYDGDIVKAHCNVIVNEFIGLFYEFRDIVEKRFL